MEIDKFLIIAYTFFFLFSCNNDLPVQSVQVDFKNWNENSLEFISYKCNLENDSLKLGEKQFVPLISHGDTLSTFYDFLEQCFENRMILVKQLNDSIKINKSLRIFENYTINTGVNYLIQIDEKVNISYTVVDGVLKTRKKEEGVSSIFTHIDSSWCINESVFVPQKLWIWNHYFVDKGLKTFGVSLIN